MSDSIIDGLPTEGESVEDVLNQVDKEAQEEKPAESSAEKEIEKLELPDEAILKKNSAWEEMREKNEALEARLNALEKPESVEKSEWVASLVGDNKDIEEKWAKEKQNLKEEWKRELIQDQEEFVRKEQEQKDYWMKWTDDRLSEVEKEFKVDFKADESKKNELSKVMIDYSPTDEQGNLDYRKGMKILNELNKIKGVEDTQKTQVKKNIADATISKESSSEKNKGVYTTNDIRGKDWRSLVDKN